MSDSTELPSGQEKYHWMLRITHWLMALLILGLIAVGWYMTGLDKTDENRYTFYGWHKSFGVVVLLLFGVRLVLRFTTHIPSLPAGLKPWEWKLSKLTHGLLYLFMLAVPLSGYAMSAAGGHGVKLFGIPMPSLFPEDKTIAGIAHEAHEIIPYILLGLVVLHIAGALKHRFMDAPENNVIRRMT